MVFTKSLLAQAVILLTVFGAESWAHATPSYRNKRFCASLFESARRVEVILASATQELERLEASQSSYRIQFERQIEWLRSDIQKLRDIARSDLWRSSERGFQKKISYLREDLEDEAEDLHGQLKQWFLDDEKFEYRERIQELLNRGLIPEPGRRGLLWLLELSDERAGEHGFGRKTVRRFIRGIVEPSSTDILGLRLSVKGWRPAHDGSPVDPVELRSAMAVFRRALKASERMQKLGLTEDNHQIVLEYAPWKRPGVYPVSNYTLQRVRRLLLDESRRARPRDVQLLGRYVVFLVRNLGMSLEQSLGFLRSTFASHTSKKRIIPDVDLYIEVQTGEEVSREWVQVFSTLRTPRSREQSESLLASIRRKLDQLTLLPDLPGSKRIFVIDFVKKPDLRTESGKAFLENLEWLGEEHGLFFELWWQGRQLVHI